MAVEDQSARRVFLATLVAGRAPASDHVEPFVKGNAVVTEGGMRLEILLPRNEDAGIEPERLQLFRVEMLRRLLFSRKSGKLH